MLNFGTFMDEVKPDGIDENEFIHFQRALLEKLEHGKDEHGDEIYLCALDKVFTEWQSEFLDGAGYPFIIRNRNVPKEIWDRVKPIAQLSIRLHKEIEEIKSLLQ